MKAILLLLCTAALTHAELPPGHRIMDETTSPDGKLAVSEPHQVSDEAMNAAHNHLVALPSLETQGAIEGVPGLKQMNHGGASATWSEDNRLLLWQVEGKWGPRAVTMVAVREGNIERQANLLALGQAELLKRTRAAHPKTYAAAVKRNHGNGSAFPDGFTTGLVLKEPSAILPAEFVVTLNSNPKGIEDQVELQAFLFGKLDSSFRLTWGEFAAFDAKSGERLLSECEGVEEALAHQLDAVLQSLTPKAREKLEAEQADWESRTQEITESWFMADGLCPLLADHQRYHAVEQRVAALAKMQKKP